VPKTFLPSFELSHVPQTFLPSFESSHVPKTFLPSFESSHVPKTFLPSFESSHVQKTFLPSFESSHAVEDVELLPALSKVDGAVRQRVLVADVDERQVLENQPSAQHNTEIIVK
jgi:hypothetical protein